MHYHADYNTGTNTVYAGGEQEVLSAAAGHPAEAGWGGRFYHDIHAAKTAMTA